MVEIRLTNTRTRTKEAFVPIDAANIRVYACGPTVYDRAHLGNARPVVVFDVLFRLLRQVYGADAVTYVRNFTDVDDKINARAAATGRPIRDITEETIGWYHDDMDALGALRPSHEPRATDYIDQMVEMIEVLIQKGFAYIEEAGPVHDISPERGDGFDGKAKPRHVYFSVDKFADYGALSGQKLDELFAGARVEVGENKRTPLDFVLWKPSNEGEPGWDGPRDDEGKRIWGRPGWHIECSAMSAELLGDVFDIHAGGIDLQFPHHENEIAQSRCAHGTGLMANVWLHNEMLQVEGKKMSKSLGNFFTVRDLLDQGIPGEVIRFVLLMTHYRKPMDWTEEKVREATDTLRKWSQTPDKRSVPELDPEFIEAVADDMNTSEAIARLHHLYATGQTAQLTACASLLGFDLDAIARQPWATPYEWHAPDETVLIEGVDYAPTVTLVGWGQTDEEFMAFASTAVRRWLMFRREKDYEAADHFKERLSRIGMKLMATRSDGGVNGGVGIIGEELQKEDLRQVLAYD